MARFIILERRNTWIWVGVWGKKREAPQNEDYMMVILCKAEFIVQMATATSSSSSPWSFRSTQTCLLMKIIDFFSLLPLCFALFKKIFGVCKPRRQEEQRRENGKCEEATFARFLIGFNINNRSPLWWRHWMTDQSLATKVDCHTDALQKCWRRLA